MSKLDRILNEIVNGLFWIDIGLGVGLLLHDLINDSLTMVGLGILTLNLGIWSKVISS